MATSKKLETIYYNGQPDGIRSIRRHLSTITTYVIPRPLLSEAKKISGITRPGIPCVIVFNLNPKMNAEIMSLIGCFQSDEAKGKLQFGPAWWFLDNKAGMEKHLQDLTATGHLGTFVGMLTDSRSFLSYPRHHYFRRILCNYLGEMVENGEITSDLETVGNVIRDVSYNNAVKYFGMK